MYIFMQVTETHSEYMTSFEEFTDSLKNSFKDYLHYENDVNYRYSHFFNEKGYRLVTITIYSNNESNIDDIVNAFISYISEQINSLY